MMTNNRDARSTRRGNRSACGVSLSASRSFNWGTSVIHCDYRSVIQFGCHAISGNEECGARRFSRLLHFSRFDTAVRTFKIIQCSGSRSRSRSLLARLRLLFPSPARSSRLLVRNLGSAGDSLSLYQVLHCPLT